MSQPTGHAPGAEDPGGSIPLPHPVKRNIKDAIVALTMANWCFMRIWSHLLSNDNHFFGRLPVTRVELLALAVNILGLALLVWLGIGIWRRSQPGFLSLILDFLFLGLLLFPADYVRSQILGLIEFGGLGGLLRNPATIPVLIILVPLLLWKHRAIARGAAMVVSITFPVALLTMAKIFLISCNLMRVKECPEPAPPALLAAREGRPRVLWIIFDETDFRLAFEKRPPGTVLPEFDRLRKEALFANHAYAPADRTIISMPALISGRRLARTAGDGCDLALIMDDTHASIDWTTLPSVFSQARALGFNTALVGWFIPYSRLLGGNLNYCSWYPMPVYAPGDSTTFGGAMQNQIASLAGPLDIRQLFIDICQGSLKDSVSVAGDPAYGLILLHLPPPHLPAVYVPAKNEFTRLGVPLPAGYFNNLMLADHELGVLRQRMETAGQWDKTWVILSADHSWRKSQTYDGIRDYRVPFLVKSPGASEAMIYSHQFNTLLTHDVILAILSGQVTNQAGVAALLDRGKPDLPVPVSRDGSE